MHIKDFFYLCSRKSDTSLTANKNITYRMNHSIQNRINHSMRNLFTVLIVCIVGAVSAWAQGDIQPVSFTQVHVNDAFWRQRLDTMQNHTIRYAFSKVEAAGQVRNFELAGKILSGEVKQGEVSFQSGQPYDDAEVYKVLEGAAYVLMVSPDPELEAYIDGLVDKICSAQEPDGYLQTNWTIHNPLHEWYGGVQWLNDWNLSHETFNVAELVECAIAYYQATGKDKLLRCAVRAADNLCDTFNADGIRMAPGHAVVEMALVRLFELTGDRKYLDECKFFLDCRGLRKFDASSDDLRANGKYWQDHLRATRQREAVGHAVRALYFYSGMADWVRYSGDEAYRTAIDAIWENIVSKKFYITGGLGARDNNEAFGENYELPNASAYCETCASVANCMFQLRMFRLTGDARYIDVLERSLYNTVLDGYALTGDRFYYPNRLATSVRGQERSEWFGTSCCPTNLCRLIPSVPGYVYATDGDGNLFVNLYIGSKAEIGVGDKKVELTQQTEYPWDGNVRITVDATETADFTLRLRIPGWAQNRPVDSDLYTYLDTEVQPVVVKVNGTAVETTTDKGYAVVQRSWKAGDVVELELPMPVHQVRSHKNLTTNEGLLAVERGPIVYCAEFVDNGGSLTEFFLPEGAPMEVRRQESKLLPGLRVICSGSATLVPYFYRAYRGNGEMEVWIPTVKPEVVSDDRLLDEVIVCDAASERAHRLQGQNMRTGNDLGWRDADNGGWISYKMKVDPDRPCEVILKHWGSDGGNRRFNILCDGEQFAYDHVDNFRPNEYYEKNHAIPFHLTKGKTSVTIRLQALPGNICGGIFGIKTALQREVPEDASIQDFMNTTDDDRAAHAYSSNGATGTARGRIWADGSGTTGLSFTMKVSPTDDNSLMLYYWGDEVDLRSFNILVDRKKIASERLLHNKPGYYYNQVYAIPHDLTAGKEQVRVQLSSSSGTKVGGINYAYTFSVPGATAVRGVSDDGTANGVGNGLWYDLSGRLVNPRDLNHKSIYVHQGKKVIN